MEELARAACRRWREWMGADGVFPDPEYDRFMDAMERLETAACPELEDRRAVAD